MTTFNGGGYPINVRSEPSDGFDSAICDAEGMILHAFRQAVTDQLAPTFDVGDECTAEVKGDIVEFTLPSITVRVDRVKSADLMAVWAKDELLMLAAAVANRIK